MSCPRGELSECKKMCQNFEDDTTVTACVDACNTVCDPMYEKCQSMKGQHANETKDWDCSKLAQKLNDATNDTKRDVCIQYVTNHTEQALQIQTLSTCELIYSEC